MSSYALSKAAKIASRGKWQEACAFLELAEKTNSDPRLPLQRGVILTEAGQPQAALSLLESLVAKHESFPPAYLFAGIAAWDTRDHDKARALWSKGRELAPRNELLGSYWALAQYAAGKDEQGRQYFGSAGFASNRGFLVRLTQWVEEQWLLKGCFFAPQDDLIETVTPASGTRQHLLRRAVRAFRARDYISFLAIMQSESVAGKMDTEDLFACAIACEMLSAYSKALEFLDRIPEQEQSADPVLAARGRCFVRLGRYEEAMDCFERVLIIGPEDFGLNYYLGVLCHAHQQHDRAREFFHRAYRDYLVDTLDYQFWQIRRALLEQAYLPRTSP